MAGQREAVMRDALQGSSREKRVHGLIDVGVHRERNIYGAQGPNPGAGG